MTLERDVLVEAAASLDRSTDGYDHVLARRIRALLPASKPAAPMMSLEEVRADEAEHTRFRYWQDWFVNCHGHPMEVIDAWQVRTMVATCDAERAAEAVQDKHWSFEEWWETVGNEMIHDTDPRRHAEAAWQAGVASLQTKDKP